ncbi:MAG: HD domain-containing protein [Spirochaetales bacterium]|uniref:HD domain-containing protein n=1 Tax=Candidatus Thalassospirochaeta sargassi TaxID=3119039 RepID=A0AAJ1MKY8_9SPIO|nr:HD domain-containing protein [Spirochaetales bacterium]
MNEISVENLPNQAFSSESLFLDDGYILISPDTPVLPGLKRRLYDWNFKIIKAEGNPEFTEIISSAETEGILLKKNGAESEQEREAAEFFESLCKFVAKLFKSYQEGNEPKLNLISDQVKKLLQMTKTHKPWLLNLAEYESNEIDYGVSQSVKTAILAIAMSDTLKLPAHKQIELGLAAILHRIGSMQIPQDLFYSEQALTPEQKKSITLFPVLGFRSLKNAEFPLPVALAVLEHRENIDGSGYPRGITGDKISLYGKLIAVASSYCAAVSKRPFRNNVDGHSGMLDLIREKGRKYDEKVLRVLLLTLTVYPIGTYVRLTDNSVGVVAETNSAEPKFPVLRMLFDAKGTYFADAPLLHTAEDDEVQIKVALSRTEVEALKAKLPNS